MGTRRKTFAFLRYALEATPACHSFRFTMRILKSLVVAAGVGAATGQAAANGPWPRWIHLPAGEPVNEDYRGQSDRCDRDGTFLGQISRYTKGCVGDPNRVTALRRLPGGAIAYVSKLAVDMDGSALACAAEHGRMDQCPTSLMLRDSAGRAVPVDADAIPYVVIPEAGPGDAAGEFSRLTGVHIGDFGVVVTRTKVVPVIVADTGPYSKIGEGSLALHRALGNEQCKAKDENGACSRVDEDGQGLPSDVTTILFPGSASDALNSENIAALTRRVGSKLWNQFNSRLEGGE